MGWRAKQRLTSATIHFFMIIGSLCMITPFAWMVLTAMKTKSEAISVNPFYIFRRPVGILRTLSKSGSRTISCNYTVTR